MEADGNLPLRVPIEVNQICTNCFLFLGIMHSQFKQAEKPNEKKNPNAIVDFSVTNTKHTHQLFVRSVSGGLHMKTEF